MFTAIVMISTVGEPIGDDVRELLVATHAHQGDEVPLAGDRVDLGDAAQIRDLHSVTGEWDLIALVRVRRHEELSDVIADRLSKVRGPTRR
jgi:DNA-binding Lrp family transcriptional regulator